MPTTSQPCVPNIAGVPVRCGVEVHLLLRSRLSSCVSFLLLACQPQRAPEAPGTVVLEPVATPSVALAVERSPVDLLAAVEAVGRQPRLVRSWPVRGISALALGIQGGVVLAGAEDGQVYRWILPEALLEARWDGPPGGGEGPVVAVGLWWGHDWAIWDVEGELRLVDLTDDRVADRLPVPTAGVQELVFPREQEQLLLALGDGSFARWTPLSGALEPLDAGPPEVDPVAEAARWAKAGLAGETALITRRGAPLTVDALREAPARLSADGRSLVGVQAGRLGLWRLDAPRALELWGGEGPVQRVAFSSDGLLVAVDRGQGAVELRDAASGLVLVSAFDAGGVGGWDPFAGPEAEVPLATVPGVAVAARSPDARWLITAAQDGSLRRWDLDALRQGRVLDTRLDRMLRADAFSPDALLARAEVAAFAGSWSRVADLLDLAVQQGAAVHPALRLRALCLAGRLGGAREVAADQAPPMVDDPAVRAWTAWLEAQPGG